MHNITQFDTRYKIGQMIEDNLPFRLAFAGEIPSTITNVWYDVNGSKLNAPKRVPTSFAVKNGMITRPLNVVDMLIDSATMTNGPNPASILTHNVRSIVPGFPNYLAYSNEIVKRYPDIFYNYDEIMNTMENEENIHAIEREVEVIKDCIERLRRRMISEYPEDVALNRQYLDRFIQIKSTPLTKAAFS